MATKRLAKELGLLRQRSTSGSKKQLVSNQIFSYIIVIDFESTCWKEKNNYGQEIIEFPAVLLNCSSGEVEAEFHTYVQPQEHPTLSHFCTELTGITQSQVEAGVPLQICLSRFCRWIQNLQFQKGLVFHRQQTPRSTEPQKLCTFLTWSDWDLGVCLQYECKRKQINKPPVLNSWIDLRSTYRMFYNRKPKGLNGALQDLGIQFEGREHSGLDDSRNTAQLAARLMRDGCVMKITRSLDRIPITSTKASVETKIPSNKEQNERASTNKPLASLHKSHNIQNVNKSSIQECQSLVSPKTILNGTVAVQEACRSITNLLNLSPFIVTSISSPSHNNIALNNIDMVQQNMVEGFSEFFVEIEERCGSYDDVMLDFSGNFDILENGNYESEETVFSFIDSVTKSETMGCNTSSLQNSEMPCFEVPNTATNIKSNNFAKKEAQIATTLLNQSEITTKISPKPQVLVPNTPFFSKTFSKQSTICTDTKDVAENHYNPKLGRSEEIVNSTNTFTDRSRKMGGSKSTFLQSKSTNSGCFAVPYPVSKPQTNFSERKLTQMTSLLLNKSEKGPTDAFKPQVLVPNTPSFSKTFPKQSTICTDPENVLKNNPNLGRSEETMNSTNQKMGTTIAFQPQVLVPNTPTFSKPKRKDSFTIYTDKEVPSTSHNSTFNSKNVLTNLSTNTSLNETVVGTKNGTSNVNNIPDLRRTDETRNSVEKCKGSASFGVPYPVSKPQTNFSPKKQAQTSCLRLNKSDIGPTNLSRLQNLVPSTSKSNSTFNVLSNLSTNLSLNETVVGTNNGTSRITSPLCLCGRRTKRQTVSNGGPNHGRGFFCCPVRRSGTLGRVQKGCEFFKWETAVLKDSFSGASVSMCQVNTSRLQEMGLRKSY